LHFKTLQTKYKRFEIVIFSTGVLVRSNTYESIMDGGPSNRIDVNALRPKFTGYVYTPRPMSYTLN